jgi:hypothetical protein
VRYRIDSNVLMHVEMTAESTAALKAALVREARALGAGTNSDLRLFQSERNSLPTATGLR